jgi:hypothetical protein
MISVLFCRQEQVGPQRKYQSMFGKRHTESTNDDDSRFTGNSNSNGGFELMPWEVDEWLQNDNTMQNQQVRTATWQRSKTRCAYYFRCCRQR